MPIEQPYTCEYAKSGRASCKKCKQTIAQDSLRLGIMVQSPHFDGKIPQWHHSKCFWTKSKVSGEADIHGFDQLRWDDQEAIRAKISGKSDSAGSSGTAAAKAKSEVSEFSVEYAASNRSTCVECQQKIEKGLVRISRPDHDHKSAGRAGKAIPQWHHIDCFVKKRDEYEFTDGAEKLDGFAQLSEEDQSALKKKLKPQKKRKAGGKNDEVDVKKVKSEEPSQNEDELEKLKTQSKELWDIKDALVTNFSMKELNELLEANDQLLRPPKNESRVTDLLADCMLFGALKHCNECSGQLLYSSTDNCYKCSGSISAYTGCQVKTQDPERKPFFTPEDFKEVTYMKKFKSQPGRKRIFPTRTAAGCSQASSEEEPVQPLRNLKFAVLGKQLKGKEKDITSALESLGALVNSKKLESSLFAVVSTKEDFADKKQKKLRDVEKMFIHVVLESFVEAIKAPDADVAALAVEHAIYVPPNVDLPKKIAVAKATKSAKELKADREDMRYAAPKLAKMKVKGGGAVEPDSGLEDTAGVYEDKGGKYNAVLNAVNVQHGTNSYYKLQLLKHDTQEKYWVFRAWGRVGTTIGSNKLESFGSKKQSAIEHFKSLYLEKTLNEWEDREHFEKRIGGFYPLDIDYGNEDEGDMVSAVEPGSKSALDKAVQNLLKMIFDIQMMKETMKEFEIDLEKMPLGKLSKKQIQEAYQILTELQSLRAKGATNTQILDASNRFYTLIPHFFGMRKPPLLDTDEIIQSKTQMLDNLLEIEIAYSIMKSDSKDSEIDPIDAHYQKLHALIKPISKDSDTFQMIETYVKNTHAATHNTYSLEVQEVFEVVREGEYDRFTPFKKLHNHMLLWHGSRTSNFAGILSQGLRIAPPEAPVTGYMFGKGLYFADMVSKSANYCFTSAKANTGLLLLCDVALGDMYECLRAEFVTKLKDGMKSCKGVGMTAPNPKEFKTIDDGVVVPCGKPINAPMGRSSLLYNEYIVYDVNQVNVKYLVQMEFHYK